MKKTITVSIQRKRQVKKTRLRENTQDQGKNAVTVIILHSPRGLFLAFVLAIVYISSRFLMHHITHKSNG
ncbi:MAG: hypothetical protein ACXAEU_10710 [Candidatus Hodarchaeales archaeon]